MRGAHTDFLFLKIFRRNYLIGLSPIFFENEAFPNIESWIHFPGQNRNIPLSCSLSSPASPFTSYIHESWTMAKHDEKTTWGAIGNLENSLGTWWEPLLLPFPPQKDFLRLFFLSLPCVADDCTHSRRLAQAARKAQAPWSCLFDAPWTTIPESVELLDGEAKEHLSLQIRFTFAVISSSSASHFFSDPVWIPPNIQVCSLGYFQKAWIGVSPSFVSFKRSLVRSFSSLSLFNNNNFLKTSFKLSSSQGTWNSTGIHLLPV